MFHHEPKESPSTYGPVDRNTVKFASLFTGAMILAGVTLGYLPSPAAAQVDLAAATMKFETNFSDEDTGIQISWDGEPWNHMEVRDPDGNLVIEVENDELTSSIFSFGLTEAFFESNEPNWSVMPLNDTLDLFPEGEYSFTGTTVNGDILTGTATLEHTLPCGPVVGVSVDVDVIIIDWEEVTQKIHPTKEVCQGGGIDIEAYMVIVESNPTFTIELDQDARQVTIPPEFIEPDTEYKLEVLAIEENGNQTITEDMFCTDNTGLIDPDPALENGCVPEAL